MKQQTPLREIFTRPVMMFLLLAFGPAWFLFALPLGAERYLSAALRQPVSLIAWSLAMWMPGLAALLMTGPEEGKIAASLGMKKLGPGIYYLWAWIAPILMILITGALTVLFGLASPENPLGVFQESLEQLPEGTNFSPEAMLGIQILASLTLAPLFNTLFAFGEELGWRGYLLTKLLPAGERKAALISGLIWGVWHAPVILQGHNYPETPFLGVLLMIVFTTLLGVFLSWLKIKTGSTWAPALAHGTLNAAAGLPLLFLPGVNMTWGGTLPSVTGWIPLSVTAGLILWVRSSQQQKH
jgi:membrane protease YdiL (CAAX protease family)